MQHKLQQSDIFTNADVENYAKAFFDPKGTQASMSSAIKPAVDRYKNRYKLALGNIKSIKSSLKEAQKSKDEKGVHNYELDLKGANEDKNALDLFKKDMITFLRIV